MHIGGNWLQLGNAIPTYVRKHILFNPGPAPPAVKSCMEMMHKIMSLGYINGEIFTESKKGKYWLQLFVGMWSHKEVMTIYGKPDNMESFKEVWVFRCWACPWHFFCISKVRIVCSLYSVCTFCQVIALMN